MKRFNDFLLEGKVLDIPLSDIRRWQDVDHDNVENFRKAIRNGDRLKPIQVVKDSQKLAKYVIRDGSHRHRAHELEGKKTIKAEILK